MSLNEDLEYLQDADRTDVQRWAWLAAKMDGINVSCGELKDRTGRDFVRLNGLELRLDTIERRCAGRKWQGRLVWAALVAAVGSWATKLWR